MVASVSLERVDLSVSGILVDKQGWPSWRNHHAHFCDQWGKGLRPQALNQAKSVSADKHQWITRLHGQVIDAIRRLLVAHPGWHSLRLDF